MATLAELLAQLDPRPLRRGKQFERICKWFLTHDPVYAHELRHVWLWDEWPGRWGIDAGIDLVAEDRHGNLWAIQAKAYNAAYSITKPDVDTFLAESGRSEFSFRLLIATTNHIGPNAKRTIENQEKQASFLGFGQLEGSQVYWPNSPSDLRARPLDPKRPTGRWAYQGDATNDVLTGFCRTDRGQLIMACGTGKTLIALFTAEKLAAERTLVLVPSLSLLAQTLREWTANSEVDFEFLPVCSDQTVTEPDAAVENTSDLGFPVTTDPEDIAGFLRRRSGPRVVFATYQSSPEIAKALALGGVPSFDFAVADESHRCAGPGSSDFATVLNAGEIKAQRRLFMTATPRYFTGRLIREAKEDDFEVVSMDNEAMFGPVFHRLTFGEAISRDLLTDYRVAVVGVDNATYRLWAEQGRFVAIGGKVTDARTLAGQIGLAKAMRRYELRRTISFHSRVKRAREFAQSLPHIIDWMPSHERPRQLALSAYASGEMAAGQRHMLLERLRGIQVGERGLLANARCLAEGVDVPTLDGVAFIDPRRSEVDIVQAVGRAIRRAPDKAVGTIVIPVFIDTEQDPTIALDDSAFKPVWDVIQALRSHDDQLGEELDQLRRQLGRWGRRPERPGKIRLDLPTGIGTEFARAFDVRLVEQTTAPWEFWFGLLEKFVEYEGHALVPKSYLFDGRQLGAWVAAQRVLRAKGRLGPDREQRLTELPTWSWDTLADRWTKGFGQLMQYVEEHGDARVPNAYVRDGYRLGAWVRMQRALRSRGTLEDDRQRRLQELPGWSWHARNDQWEENFSRLLKYVEQQGDARVPLSYAVDGHRLGKWVMKQRHSHVTDRLDLTRQNRLQELPGWTWSTLDEWWDEGFPRLVRYVERHGHASVPQSYVVDGYRLGAWVANRRTDYRDGTLSNERQERLQALPGWAWSARDALWEEGFDRLLKYVEREHHARVPGPYVIDDYPLGAWVQSQRGSAAKLNADRRSRLQDLPGWSWNARADQWEEAFSQLLRYVEEHGDARVSSSYTVEGFRFGKWINVQRTAHLKGKLDADRERRLQSLPGWSWNTVTDQWEEAFGRLRRYVEEHGDALVPYSYTVDSFRLGVWTQKQRAENSKGALESDRKHRLAALRGWTWVPRDNRWEEGFSRLLRYVEEHGDALVPYAYKIEGYTLGAWVVVQRQRKAKSVLDAERQRRLEEVRGWSWEPNADRWESGFTRLLSYVDRHGHAQVPKSCRDEDGFNLGGWVREQRANYARGALDAERQRRLVGQPGWTWTARSPR